MWVTRRGKISWGITLLVVSIALGAFLTSLPESTTLDEWWHGVSGDMRSPGLLAFAHVLDVVGAGTIGIYVVPLAIGAALLLVRGWRTAVFAITTFACSAVLVQVLKQTLGRARPEDLMVATDYGSFPSGHTANAATIAIVLWLLFPRAAVAVAGSLWVLLMAFSRTMVSAHWITDTWGGAMLGIAVGLLVAAAMLDWATEHRSERGDAPASTRDQNSRGKNSTTAGSDLPALPHGRSASRLGVGQGPARFGVTWRAARR